jgi:cytochrome o ubiquinol oxidase subunit III
MHTNEKISVGFWTYLMSDCVLFATLFATFAVLRDATAGGPGGAELFSLNFVFVQTLILLASSFTAGLALVTRWKKTALLATLLLGLMFLGLEVAEFRELLAEDHGPSRSAFLSAFFTLVGTHGAHVFLGCVAIILLLVASLRNSPLVPQRLQSFVLFWHFLDVVWIFIFTFVYLLPLI